MLKSSFDTASHHTSLVSVTKELMMKFAYMISAAILLPLIAACTTTETTEVSSTAIATAPTEETQKAELVCRKTERTGSRLRKNEVCRTQQEWDQIEEVAKRRIRDSREIGNDPAGATLGP